MQVIHAESVSHALSQALLSVNAIGIKEQSRVGDVLVFPTPVTTVYHNPRNRVLWSPLRDANPFFHLFEALWMLTGRNDLYYPQRFNNRFGEYSDDGKTLWGAYGWRWREFFGFDQLNIIVNELTSNPASRRCVLSMWNAYPYVEEENKKFDTASDLTIAMLGGKDVPCNTHVYFDCRGGVLNMTVCNRSNDVLWGCYGANAVHFSILLEYMAARIGVPVGVYRQMSNNLHLYTDIVKENGIVNLANSVTETDRYRMSHIDAPLVPLVDCGMDDWHRDLKRMVAQDGIPNPHGWSSRFISEVAVPMWLAHDAWREKRYDDAYDHALRIVAWDWRLACIEWLERRAAKRALKEKSNG